MQDAEKQLKMAETELEYCDNKTQDILHELELVEHGRREMANIAREMTEIRRRRRVAKNVIELVTPIVEWKNQQSGALIKLANAIGKMKQAKEHQNSRSYEVRTDESGKTIGHKAY